MYRFLIFTCLATAAALAAMLGLSSNQPQADVRFVNGASVHSLDPGKMSWMQDIRLAYGLWEGLLSYDPAGTPAPAVARRYEVSPDGLTYTFHLRPEARWSNGDPVAAADFRFAWLRVLDPAMAANYYSYMTVIDGGQDYYDAMQSYRKWQESRGWPSRAEQAKMPDAPPQPSADRVGIRVLDPLTLQVRLARPVAYFPELVAFATFLPLHEKSMSGFIRDEAGLPPIWKKQWLEPGNLVCNGPFVLERWELQYRLLLRRNEQYWDRASVPSERIEVLESPDVNTAFQAYETGSVDLLTNLPEIVAPALLADQRAGRRNDLHVFPVLGTYYYRFNCTSGPLSDSRVRRALAMCVDRRTIVDRLTRRGEPAQASFVCPGIFATLPAGKRIAYVPSEGLAFDPAEARKLLAEAGFGPGKGKKPLRHPDGKPLTILFSESPEHQPIAEFVRKTWKDHLGVEVELEKQLSKIAGQRMREHKFDIGRSGWFADYPDPSGFLFMFQTGNGQNDSRFSSAEYDRLMAEADAESDPARRYELLRRAERIVVAEQAAIIPIYQYVGQYMFRPNVIGVQENPMQQIMLKHVGKR